MAAVAVVAAATSRVATAAAVATTRAATEDRFAHPHHVIPVESAHDCRE